MFTYRMVRTFLLVSLPVSALLHAAEPAKPAQPAAAGTAKDAPKPAVVKASKEAVKDAPKTAAAQAAKAAATPGTAMAPTTSADRITLVRPTASVEIMAEPSKVWKKLVSPEGLQAFSIDQDKKKTLDKVGEFSHAALEGDKGNLVVTHVAKDREWRAAFEPENGNYLCSVRFQLKSQGNNTLLAYSDWYSDEKPATVDQTLKKSQQAMMEGLARFKGLIEKTSAAGANP